MPECLIALLEMRESNYCTSLAAFCDSPAPSNYQDVGCRMLSSLLCETESVEYLVILRRISMAGLSSRTVSHLADAIHAAVVGAQKKA